MSHHYQPFSRMASNLPNMVVFHVWAPLMEGQHSHLERELKTSSRNHLLISPPPAHPQNILTFSSSEMFRPTIAWDLGAWSGSFLVTSTWTQSENTDEHLLISVSGIYLDLQLIKRTRWLLLCKCNLKHQVIQSTGSMAGIHVYQMRGSFLFNF